MGIYLDSCKCTYTFMAYYITLFDEFVNKMLEMCIF